MKPSIRKLALIVHVAASVGWLGATAGVLVLAIAGLTSDDATTVGAAYLATDLIWRFLIIPMSLAALLSGLVQAIGTPWGLVRYYWVTTKLLLTVGAIVLLTLHTGSLLPALSAAADSSPTVHSSHGQHGKLSPRVHLVVAAGGTLLVLLVTLGLSVYKPWGRTRFRRQAEPPGTEREPP